MTVYLFVLKIIVQLFASMGGRVTASLSYIYTYQLYSLSVSLKRLSGSEQFNTTMNTPFFRLERQHPAVSVCPVFIPSHPFPSRMFVLNHLFTSFSDLYSSEKYSYLFTSEFITCLKSLFLEAQALKSMMSLAEEMFIAFWSPWGFENRVWISQSSSAFAFISLMNSLTQLAVFSSVRSSFQMVVNISLFSYFCAANKINPMTQASTQAASLPEGSMAPQRRSLRMIQEPDLRLAVVPIILEAVSETLTNMSKID